MNKQISSNVLQGIVVHGEKLGRRIGFPTANLEPTDSFAYFPKGVYAVLVRYMNKEYKGVMNIGIRPTIARGGLSVEVHLLDFNDDLYGKNLEIKMVEFIRKEQKFDGLPALERQIMEDIKKARDLICY